MEKQKKLLKEETLSNKLSEALHLWMKEVSSDGRTWSGGDSSSLQASYKDHLQIRQVIGWFCAHVLE